MPMNSKAGSDYREADVTKNDTYIFSRHLKLLITKL